MKSGECLGEKETFAARRIPAMLLALAAVLALHVNFEIVEGLETDSALLNLFSRIPNSFSVGLYTDVLSFAAIYLLFRHAGTIERRPDGWTLALAAVFAVLLAIGRACASMGSLAFFTANIYQVFLSLFCVVGYAALFYALLRAIFHAADTRREEEAASLAHPMRTAALVIFLCYLPWLLMNYPCSFSPDSIGQLMQWAGIDVWSAHHPPLSTAIMGLCWSLGRRLVDENFGCFLYLLLQAVCAALVLALTLSDAYRMSGSRKLYTLGLLFFAATPIWGCFAQWFEKDFLYTIVFTLDMTLILRVINDRRCTWTRAGLIALVTLTAILLRKTGLYELVTALLILALWLRRRDGARMLAATVAAAALGVCVNSALYPALGIKDGSVKEALSIPFQQTARYVNLYGDEVTPEERANIDAVLVYDELDKYDPEVSDAVKSNYRGDGTKLPAYFDTWFQMLGKHPGVYIDAFFDQCYGYLAPVRVQLDAYILSEYWDGVEQLGVGRVFGDAPTRYFDSLRELFTTAPLTKYLCMAGLYTWILMGCFVQILRKKDYSALIAFVPGIMNILVCIASPLCSSMRYELPVLAMMPLMLGLTAERTRRAEEK